MSKSKIKTSGISILEAMIAISLLLLGILALTKIFPLALKIGQTAEDSTIAANLAQAKLEELFSWSYENIPLGAIEPRHRLSADASNPFYRYERETDVSYVDADLNPTPSATGLKQITAVVYWQSRILSTEKNIEVKLLMVEK